MANAIDISPSSRPLNVVNLDFGAIKARQQQMWASGDFSVIGNTLQLVGETLCEVCARCLGDGFGRRQVDGTRVGGGWWRRVMTIA